MTEITKLTRRYIDNTVHTHICGLNIFTANNVGVGYGNDPRNIFLRAIIQRYPCALHAGVLAFEGDSPQEFFNVSEESFKLINTGVYGGTFYSVPEEQNGCYFDDASVVWESGQLSNMLYALSCDALAVYAAIDRADSVGRLHLIDRCIAASTEWIDQILEVAGFIVLSSSDGWYFNVLSKDDSCLEMIDRSVELAEESIESSVWYQENSGLLVWKGDEANLDYCLKLPYQPEA